VAIADLKSFFISPGIQDSHPGADLLAHVQVLFPWPVVCHSFCLSAAGGEFSCQVPKFCQAALKMHFASWPVPIYHIPSTSAWGCV